MFFKQDLSDKDSFQTYGYRARMWKLSGRISLLQINEKQYQPNEIQWYDSIKEGW